MYKLEGKVALVTGAGGQHGMGRAIATRLAQEGADVIVNDLVQNPYPNHPSGWGGISDVVREIESMSRRAVGVVADITDSAQVEHMVGLALERFGHIDILVNNAGSRPGRDRVPVVEMPEEAWDVVQRVNVKGTFLCSRAVGRGMIRHGQGGKIIIMSSLSGKRGAARFAAYCTSKFALIGLTQSLAQELAPYHINVNALCPGPVETDRLGLIAAALAPEGQSSEEYLTNMMRERTSQIPLGRVAQPSDVAMLAAFLASSESDYLTGLSISVSGGELMD